MLAGMRVPAGRMQLCQHGCPSTSQAVPVAALGKAASVQGAAGQQGAGVRRLSAMHGGPAPQQKTLLPRAVSLPEAGDGAWVQQPLGPVHRLASPGTLPLSRHHLGNPAAPFPCPGPASPASKAPCKGSWLQSSPSPACPHVPLAGLRSHRRVLQGGGNIPAMSVQF